MASESCCNFVLWVLGLTIAGEDHSLLSTHHKLGRLDTHTQKKKISFELKLPLFLVLWSHHCGFILQCNASQHSSRFVAGKLQGEGLDWLHKFTDIPPHHLPVCRRGEYIRTCVCGRKGGKRGGEGWWDQRNLSMSNTFPAQLSILQVT